MNARIAKKIIRYAGRRYSPFQIARAERRAKRAYRREDLARDPNLYYESRVGQFGKNLTEVYHVRVCIECRRHLECPCCNNWCDDLDCLDRDHDKCTFLLPPKTEPIRVEVRPRVKYAETEDAP